jgi:hypothetical protein
MTAGHFRFPFRLVCAWRKIFRPYGRNGMVIRAIIDRRSFNAGKFPSFRGVPEGRGVAASGGSGYFSEFCYWQNRCLPLDKTCFIC